MEVSPSSTLETSLRRVPAKYIITGRSPLLSTSAGVMLLLLGCYTQYGNGSTVVLCCHTLSFLMACGFLFKIFFGSITRRSPKDHGHWICESLLSNNLCDAIDWAAARSLREVCLLVLAVVAVGECGKCFSGGQTLMLCGVALLAQTLRVWLSSRNH